mgnify:CR=1 FL=1
MHFSSLLNRAASLNAGVEQLAKSVPFGKKRSVWQKAFSLAKSVGGPRKGRLPLLGQTSSTYCVLVYDKNMFPTPNPSHQSVFLLQAVPAFEKPCRILAGFKKRSSRLQKAGKKAGY